MQRNGPLRFTSRTRCHSSSVVSTTRRRASRPRRCTRARRAGRRVPLDDRLEHRRDLALAGDVDGHGLGVAAGLGRSRRRPGALQARRCRRRSTGARPAARRRDGRRAEPRRRRRSRSRDRRRAVAAALIGTPPGRRRRGSPRRTCTPRGRRRGTARCRRRPSAVPSRCSGMSARAARRRTRRRSCISAATLRNRGVSIEPGAMTLARTFGPVLGRDLARERDEPGLRRRRTRRSPRSR